MLSKSSELISVSLNDDHFKAVHIRGSGSNSKIIQILVEDVKGLAESELVRLIQTVIKKFNVKESEFVCVISSAMASTKNIEIPSINPEEIKSIVNLQASRHTPFSREEIQIGYINTGIYKTNYTKVLLVIANRSVIKKNLDIFEKAGLRVRKVLFASEGIAQFYADVLPQELKKTPLGIIDFGKTATDFSIIVNGVPIYSRGIAIGANQLSFEGASARDKLIKELTQTIESYKSEDINQIPARFILTTKDNHTKDLQSVLKDKIGWDAEIDSYLDHVKANDGVLEQMAGSFSDHSLLDVIAASSLISSVQVNLIPEEIQLQKTVEDQGQEILKTTMLGIIILIVVVCSLGLKWYFSSAFLTKLKETYQSNTRKVSELKAKSLKTNIVQDFFDQRMVSLEVINEFYRNIPNEIYLTNVLMDENGNISLQGISDIPSLVFNLGTSLKESSLFKSVEIKSTTAKKDRGKDVSAFEITLRLKSAPEEEKPAAEVKK